MKKYIERTTGDRVRGSVRDFLTILCLLSGFLWTTGIKAEPVYSAAGASGFCGTGGMIPFAADTAVMEINELTIVFERPESAMRGSMLSEVSVDLDMIKAFPKVLGNSDPLRYLQGVPLYGVSHLFGFFSVFNPSHFPSMKFTGATGPKNANMIGGMIRMELPGKVPEKVGGSVDVGIMSAQGTLKIPVGKKAGLFISARQSYLNLLYKRWLKLDGSPIRYDFGDYNMTWYFEPGKKDRVWADFYFGRDNIKPTLKGYLKGRRLMGMIADDSEEYAKITVYNTIKNGDNLVYIGKDFINHNDNRFKLFIKTEENEFIEVDNIRNIDNAYIKSGAHDFKKYDIITIEE